MKPVFGVRLADASTGNCAFESTRGTWDIMNPQSAIRTITATPLSLRSWFRDVHRINRAGVRWWF